jgi:hypothetical protein
MVGLWKNFRIGRNLEILVAVESVPKSPTAVDRFEDERCQG